MVSEIVLQSEMAKNSIFEENFNAFHGSWLLVTLAMTGYMDLLSGPFSERRGAPLPSKK